MLNHRERRPSEKLEIPFKVRERRSSAGFLEHEANKDLEVKKKREKYVSTGDGYSKVKKMSVHNIDYNVMSQDLANKRHVMS